MRIPSRLCIVSAQSGVGLELMNCKIGILDKIFYFLKFEPEFMKNQCCSLATSSTKELSTRHSWCLITRAMILVSRSQESDA